MKLFGFKPGVTGIDIKDIKHDRKVAIGGKFSFSFTVVNTNRKAVETRIEYAIEFLTSTGKISKKVFQLREKIMAPGTSEFISKKQSFTDLTTRKHFKGGHTLLILLNGKPHYAIPFQVV